jgi:hypothetical protein
MKPLVADEMFPEGIDIEDVSLSRFHLKSRLFTFPRNNFQSGNSSTGIMLDLAASEKDVHADFYNGESNKTETYDENLNKPFMFVLLRFRGSVR